MAGWCARDALIEIACIAAGLDHAELEEQIAVRAREVARLLLQEHLDLRAAREQRPADAAERRRS